MKFKKGDVLTHKELCHLVWIESITDMQGYYRLRSIKHIRRDRYWHSLVSKIDNTYRLLDEPELRLLHLLIT